MTRRWSIWSLVFGLALWAITVEPAFAQDSKRVVVQSFRGPSSGPARNAVVAALTDRSDVEIVPASELGGASSGSALHDAAAEAQVSAIVEGKVSKMGKLLRVTVSVRDADSGEVVHEEEFVKKQAQLKSISEAFWPVMGSHIMSTRAPEKPAKPSEREPEPVADQPREQESEREVDAEVEDEEAPSTLPANRSAKHPALIASIGPRMMWRSLAYDGPTILSSYSSHSSDGGSPAINAALNVLWFPGAHYRSDWLSDLGLEGDLDYSMGLKSKQEGKELDTKAFEISVGAIYRISLDAFEPRFRLGYVNHTFDVDVPSGTPLPAVSYSALRLGAGTVVNILDSFNFDVGFSYLLVLDSGDVGSKAYASDLSTKGWEVGGGATVRFKEVYGVRAGVDFRRYNLDFKSMNASLLLPSSATDDYLRATVSFVYYLPGMN